MSILKVYVNQGGANLNLLFYTSIEEILHKKQKYYTPKYHILEN